MLLNFEQIIILGVIFLLFYRRCTYLKTELLSFDRDFTTILRGLAIILVVIHHVGNYSGSRIFTPLGGIGVAIFLVVSGYGITESYKKKGLADYWRGKITRVLMPMVIVEILDYCILECGLSVREIVNHIFCIDRNWYIRYLFYWYALFYFFVKFFSKRYHIALSVASSVMLIFLPEIEAEQSLSFVSGVLFSRYKDWIKVSMLSSKVFWCVCLGLFMICCISLFMKQLPSIRMFHGTIIFSSIQLLLKFTGAWLIMILLNKYLTRYASFDSLTYIGMISYEVYLVHCKLLTIVGATPDIIGVVAFYGLTIVLSYILYKLNKIINDYINKVIWQRL